MRFKNTTKNSVYLEDIDLHIPYEQDTVFELDTDHVKKSKAFQNLAIVGAFEVVEATNDRIEQNILKLRQDSYDADNAQERDSEDEYRMESGNKPDVIVQGNFYEAGGYAKTNRNLAVALYSKGCNVEINPTSASRSDLNELEAKMINSLRKKVGKDAIRIDSIVPSFSSMSMKMPYRVLYTTVEASSLPKQIVNVCNSYDEVWVTSDFCKEVMQNEGVNKSIITMPNAIQTKTFHENYEPHEFRPELNSFVFCSLFGWSYRKGWDALLKAYLQSFSGDDDVSLLIISRYQYSYYRSNVIKNQINEFISKYGGSNPPHIARCSRVVPEFELPKIYKACDAFVLPSRGEGFGLPYCESSLCGLPVIATNHSGHTMFLNEENATMVDIDYLEKVPKGSSHVHYWDNQFMPSLKSKEFVSRLSDAMLHVYSNYDEALQKNKNLQNYIINNYSFDVAAKRYYDKVSSIWESVGSESK